MISLFINRLIVPQVMELDESKPLDSVQINSEDTNQELQLCSECGLFPADTDPEDQIYGYFPWTLISKAKGKEGAFLVQEEIQAVFLLTCQHFEAGGAVREVQVLNSVKSV
ncbi:hypothetical protein ABVT39_002383 [Epinephelus coioides]